jgi:isocitrate/isopropylmalate dehydrogenase
MIPGDGIGPEIAQSVEAIFAAAKVNHPIIIPDR